MIATRLISIIITSCFIGLCYGDNPIVVIEPQVVYEPNEITHFDVIGENFIVCQADGTIRMYSISTGKLKKVLKVNEKYCQGHPSRSNIQISKKDPWIITFIGGEIWEDDELYGLIIFYDLINGTELKSVKLKNSISLYHEGFDDSNRFYCVAANTQKIYCLDPITSKIESITSYDNCNWIWTVASGNGAYLANFFSSSNLEIVDKGGGLIWKKGGWFTPIPLRSKQLSEVLVCLGGNDRNKICAFDFSDGQTIWEKDIEEGVDVLCAAGVDGKRQACFIGGQLYITSFPEDTKVAVPGVTNKCDTAFIEDGTKLLCLPALEKTREDKENNTVRYGRKSRILKLIECETGEVLKQFDLSKLDLKMSMSCSP